jgi:membrane-associated phospholipid phosphatase
MKNNHALRLFLVLSLGWIVSFLIAYLITEKGDLELWLNEKNNHIADVFFKYWTHVGDGAVYAVIIILLLAFYSYWSAFYLLLVSILQTILVQILKLVFFPDAPRPKSFFGESVNLHFVEGVEVHAWNSFPSGHTATAFAIACALSILMNHSKNSIWGIVLFVIAALVALSRVYLLQHFFIDTAVGAFLGIIAALIVSVILGRFSASEKWNRGLFYTKK